MAFTAAKLMPCLTTTCVIGYAQSVLVEKYGVEESLRRLLPTLSVICHHTDIVHMERKGTVMYGHHYVWCHKDIRPWGQNLPVQCERCGHTRSWDCSEGPSGTRLIRCVTPSCNNRFSVKARQGKWFGSGVDDGRWLELDLDGKA